MSRRGVRRRERAGFAQAAVASSTRAAAFACRSGGAGRCLPGRPHEQHRHRRHARDLLGIAAEHHAVHAAPAVRADDDEIGGPLDGRLDDDVAGASREALDRQRVDRHRGGADASAPRSEDALAALPQRRQDGAHVGRAGLETGREDQLVEDVQEPDRPSGRSGEGDRLIEPLIGRRAAVDRDQDALIHGCPPEVRCDQCPRPRTSRR